MQKIYFVIALLFTVNFLQAQVYDGPESVEEDPSDGSVFVSNASGGTIIKLMPDGSLQSFASGFTSGPHGLELIGDTLYACDGGYIRLVNRTTGAIINSVNLSASFLNGITHKGTDLFITDFSAKKIFRFNTKNNSFNLFTSTLTKTPNGIIYDYLNDRLVYCCWGSSAPVYEVNLTDSTINFLANTATSNCDGIAMNCQGKFYIASWSPNAIKEYNSTFSTVNTITVPGLSSPADIYFTANDTLIVPNSGANTVSKTHIASCITDMPVICFEGSTRVYPNPVNDVLTIENHSSLTEARIIDVLGQVVFSYSLSGGSNRVNIENLRAGTYFIQLNGGNEIQETIKVFKK
jgi:Secretion system C-terminal sorting domain